MRAIVVGILLALMALSGMGLVGALESDNFTVSINRTVER